jgi:hypothetical protein
VGSSVHSARAPGYYSPRPDNPEVALDSITSGMHFASVGSQEEPHSLATSNDRRNDPGHPSCGRLRTHRSNGGNVVRSTEEVEGEEEVLDEQSSPLNERRERERGPSPEDRVEDDLARKMAKAEITSQDTA